MENPNSHHVHHSRVLHHGRHGIAIIEGHAHVLLLLILLILQLLLPLLLELLLAVAQPTTPFAPPSRSAPSKPSSLAHRRPPALLKWLLPADAIGSTALTDVVTAAIRATVVKVATITSFRAPRLRILLGRAQAVAARAARGVPGSARREVAFTTLVALARHCLGVLLLPRSLIVPRRLGLSALTVLKDVFGGAGRCGWRSRFGWGGRSGGRRRRAFVRHAEPAISI